MQEFFETILAVLFRATHAPNDAVNQDDFTVRLPMGDESMFLTGAHIACIFEKRVQCDTAHLEGDIHHRSRDAQVDTLTGDRKLQRPAFGMSDEVRHGIFESRIRPCLAPHHLPYKRLYNLDKKVSRALAQLGTFKMLTAVVMLLAKSQNVPPYTGLRQAAHDCYVAIQNSLLKNPELDSGAFV